MQPIRYLWIILLFILLLSFPCFAQTPGFPRQSSADPNSPTADEDETRVRIAHDMEKKAAKDRVAALKNDTDKLVKLSMELKSYVEKSDENVLSLSVIKKAEEIEKLAKSVKDKMKGPN